MSSAFIKVEVSQSAKSFRFNGVTFAKRQLAELLPQWDANEETTFYRFLVIMPFIAECKEPKDAPTEAGKYAVVKAKRMYAALNLPDVEGAVIAFMHVAGEIGKIAPEDFHEIADGMHDHICDCGKQKRPELRLVTKDGQTVH